MEVTAAAPNERDSLRGELSDPDYHQNGENYAAVAVKSVDAQYHDHCHGVMSGY